MTPSSWVITLLYSWQKLLTGIALQDSTAWVPPVPSLFIPRSDDIEIYVEYWFVSEVPSVNEGTQNWYMLQPKLFCLQSSRLYLRNVMLIVVLEKQFTVQMRTAPPTEPYLCGIPNALDELGTT